MEWRVIPGFSRYSVSDTGLVKRDVTVYRTKPGPLSVHICPEGYPRCALTDDNGRSVSRSVHVLVMLAFIGPRPDGMVTCHSDGNPQNNHISNLRYDTHKGNVHDAIRHGTQVRGAKQRLAKLTDDLVASLRMRYIKEPITLKKLASEYSIKQQTALSIVKGETWAHVTPNGDLREKRENPPLIGFRGWVKTSPHKGVSFSSRNKKWVARGPGLNGKAVCLGEFKTEAEAAMAVSRHLEHAGRARPLALHRVTASGRHERIWEAL